MRVVRILWASLSFATVLFLVVLAFVKSNRTALPEPQTPILLVVLASVSVVLAGLSLFFPRHLHRTALERIDLAIEEVDDPDAIGMFRAAAPKKRVFAESAKARDRALTLYATPFILGMALGEAIAICGLTLGILGFSIVQVLPFFVVCWALAAWRFPTERKIFGPLEEIHRAKLT